MGRAIASRVVASKSRPGTHHLVELREGYTLYCPCKGASFGHVCRHMVAAFPDVAVAMKARKVRAATFRAMVAACSDADFAALAAAVVDEMARRFAGAEGRAA